MKKLLYLITVIPLCFLCACAVNNAGNSSTEKSNMITAESSEPVYRKITAEQAKSMMDEGKPYILLDVRTDEEYKEKRIEGAILIPDYEIANRADTELPDKNALILIYCRSGQRSANAAHKLIAKGYTNVYDFGGIIVWPYNTVSD